MLTSAEALATFDFRNGHVLPDRLTRYAHAPYLAAGDELLTVYREGIGATRQQVHQRAERVLAKLSDCSSRRMAAFIKLLDDVSEYESDRGRKAAELRRQVFQAAAKHHPLVSQEQGIFVSEHWSVKKSIAESLQMPWAEIERKLYADVIEFHTLKAFQGYETAAALLARYNVAQVQASLYRATRMTLWVRSDLKTIVRAIKLSKLMHLIRPLDHGEFQILLSGPSSALRTTRRYGVAMARMIPTLLSCKDWRMSATVDLFRKAQPLQLCLSSQDGFTSPVEPQADFDSEVEADLMAKWQTDPVAGWSLVRESEILVRHQKVFLPDFQLKHESGKRIHVEVMGYWTPEYIEAKLQTLQEFQKEPILLIAQQDREIDMTRLPEAIRNQVIWYKTKIPYKELVERLARVF